MGYTSTVTEKGMVTLPVELRRKYQIKRGCKVEFVETEQGILIIPIPNIQDLFGADPSMREVATAISKGRLGELEHEKTE